MTNLIANLSLFISVIVMLALAQLSALSQGTVIFNNRVSGATSHVWLGGSGAGILQGNSSIDSPPGTTDYSAFLLVGTVGGFSAATTFAQLLAAPGVGAAESSLIPAQGVTTFRTGAAAGNVAQLTATLNGVPRDAASATVEMVAWDNSSGLYSTWTTASVGWQQGLIFAARSLPFTVFDIGGNVNPPPSLTQLQSFGYADGGPPFTPEPSSFCLALFGGSAWYIRRFRAFTQNQLPKEECS